jgi:hypothetical protein
MKKQLKLALAAATSVLLLAGCTDFLKGPGLNTNPNVPTSASPDQLYTGAQIAVMAQWENYPFMLFFLWAQQISGVNRQWQNYADFKGGTDQNTSDAAFNQAYGPGGLLDLRKVDSAVTISGNLKLRGESRVLEALYIGTAADIFGSIPYSTALTPVPTYDTQAQVYTEVQATLDSAITDLNSAPSTVNAGPLADFFFGNDYTKWIALANTLKARFYMHTARTGTTTYDAAILDSVIKYAQIGIADTLGNFSTTHTGTPGEQNLFFSFLFSRQGDVQPSSMHINLIKQAGETGLLAVYYKPNSIDSTFGSAPDASLPGVASFATVATTPVPIVTYVENQMLLAEANLINGTSVGGTPINILNGVRALYGGAALASSGAVLHENIIREKYIHAFFNLEVWDDYLRTCYPNVPATANMISPGGSTLPYVPARLPIGITEQSANSNVPATIPSGLPMNGNNGANPTNPQNLVDLVGAACTGQVNRPGT